MRKVELSAESTKMINSTVYPQLVSHAVLFIAKCWLWGLFLVNGHIKAVERLNQAELQEKN